ncbi:SGNH/GDSL hydrolase family protein [Patescibacteria group bacterium]|nr:SGNH/GDSL hydrolase family protein [Patescibacteria group bacterium]
MKFLKNLGINIGITLIMLLVVFVIGEIVSRSIFKFQTGGATAIHLQIFEGSDIYGWSHNPGAVDYYGYGNPTPEIKINSLGFRDDEIPLEKSENEKRIVVTGDSFTFGMGVTHENTFTEILEENLNAKNDGNSYNVINTGSIGYTIDNEYLVLKEKALQLDPDMAIVAFFTGNDVTELRRHEWITDNNGVPTKLVDVKHYVDEENRLRYKGEDEPISYFWNFLYKRLLILEKKMGINESTEPTLTWPAYLDPSDPNGDPRVPAFWDKIEIVLAQMKKDLDEKGIKLVVVAIPMDVQTNKKYWGKYSEIYFDNEAYEKNRPQTKLAELCTEYEIDLIDLLPYFREVPDTQYLYFESIDPHWTNEGHQMAADIIMENLPI